MFCFFLFFRFLYLRKTCILKIDISILEQRLKASSIRKYFSQFCCQCRSEFGVNFYFIVCTSISFSSSFHKLVAGNCSSSALQLCLLDTEYKRILPVSSIFYFFCGFFLFYLLIIIPGCTARCRDVACSTSFIQFFSTISYCRTYIEKLRHCILISFALLEYFFNLHIFLKIV